MSESLGRGAKALLGRGGSPGSAFTSALELGVCAVDRMRAPNIWRA